jgi:DNA-binding winged helix-turn-helix (wHTH) protein
MNSSLHPSDEPATLFQFAELTFDCRSRLLTRNGVELRLSPKAQHLLRLLVLARPQALSREELYDALWPSTFVCETNLAGVVKELRRALGDDARTPRYIRTVHGFGYAFHTEVAVPPPIVAATLFCEGIEHLLHEGENLIGRAHGGRVVLSHNSVSRRHAVIRLHDGEISIKDLHSTNGTFIDGQRIGSAPVSVTSSAHIELGAVAASIRCRKALSTAKLRLNVAEIKRMIADRTLPS